MNAANASVAPVAVQNAARKAWSLLLSSLVMLALVIGVAVLYWFNPAHYGFYPRCALHETTGLLCPGCGSLRALHQLLHGNVAEAFRLNALLVLSLPLCAWLGGLVAIRKFQQRQLDLAIRPFWMWTGFAILLVFGIG